MSKFKPYRDEQLMLFPNSVKDYVPEGHLARAINNIVEQLKRIKGSEKNKGVMFLHFTVAIFYGNLLLWLDKQINRHFPNHSGKCL